VSPAVRRAAPEAWTALGPDETLPEPWARRGAELSALRSSILRSVQARSLAASFAPARASAPSAGLGVLCGVGMTLFVGAGAALSRGWLAWPQALSAMVLALAAYTASVVAAAR
jgi:hypothetical protein